MSQYTDNQSSVNDSVILKYVAPALKRAAQSNKIFYARDSRIRIATVFMRMYPIYVKTHSFFVFPHSPWRIWRTPCSAPCGPCSSPGPPPSSCRCRPSGQSPTPGRSGDVRRRWPRGSAAGSSPARAGSPHLV